MKTDLRYQQQKYSAGIGLDDVILRGSVERERRVKQECGASFRVSTSDPRSHTRCWTRIIKSLGCVMICCKHTSFDTKIRGNHARRSIVVLYFKTALVPLILLCVLLGTTAP